MFAIKCGEKFIRIYYYTLRNNTHLKMDDICSVTLSSKPNTAFKYHEEANDVLKVVHEFLNKRIKYLEKTIEKNDTAFTKKQKTLDKYKATLAKLIEQPYKEVAEKVKIIEDRIENLPNTYSREHVSSMIRDINRMCRIIESNPVCVKID